MFPPALRSSGHFKLDQTELWYITTWDLPPKIQTLSGVSIFSPWNIRCKIGLHICEPQNVSLNLFLSFVCSDQEKAASAPHYKVEEIRGFFLLCSKDPVDGGAAQAGRRQQSQQGQQRVNESWQTGRLPTWDKVECDCAWYWILRSLALTGLNLALWCFSWDWWAVLILALTLCFGILRGHRAFPVTRHYVLQSIAVDPTPLTSYIAPPRAVEGQESTFRYILVPFRYLALCSTASLSLNRRNFTTIVGGRVLALPLVFPIQPSCSCTRCNEDQILVAGSVGICGLLTRGLAW